MSKLKLFENTFNKLVSDKAFIAYYLEQATIAENKSHTELMAVLACSAEDYYKLGLCKAPEINADDLAQRITKIATYANVSALMLSNILSPENASEKVLQMQESPLSKSWSGLKEKLSLPKWIVTSRTTIYQTSLTILVLLLFVFLFTPKTPAVKNIQAFMPAYNSYTDNIKYTHLQDNTYVHKNKL